MPDHFGVYDGMKVWEFLDFFAAAYQVPHIDQAIAQSAKCRLSLNYFFRLNHFVEGATIRAPGLPAIFSYWNVNLGV